MNEARDTWFKTARAFWHAVCGVTTSHDDPEVAARAIVWPADMMTAFEILAIAASESMQAQTFAEVIDAVTVLLDRLRPQQQARAEDLVLRLISALGEHVLTADLEAALAALMSALTRSSRIRGAAAVGAARDRLAASIGQLNSRTTRVEGAA